MRRTKREIIAAEASGDEDMLTAKSILLRRQREEYAKFSKEAGLLTQNERTQVYGFGKSVAQKAVQAFKRQLLPNVKNAVIPDKKLTEYALNKNHPIGKHKAIAFEKYLGYNISNKDMLIAEIKSHLKLTPAKLRDKTEYGQPYEVKMKIKGANGKTAWVKTGWIIDENSDAPRLTSIYVDE